MACPGGCIGGGGQPKSLDPLILSKRMKAIYSIDERSAKRKSHENLAVNQLYEEFLGTPCGEMSHHLLHTHYTDRSTDVSCRPIITHLPKAASLDLPVMESQPSEDR
jgi:NADP-reducing hydrogenase subunit HndD